MALYLCLPSIHNNGLLIWQCAGYLLHVRMYCLHAYSNRCLHADILALLLTYIEFTALILYCVLYVLLSTGVR